MRVLNLFIFLILFLGLIDSVNAQTCSYTDNIQLTLTKYFSQKYNLTFPSALASHAATHPDFKITSSYYFPTFIRINCDYPSDSNNALFVNFKTYDKNGNCTVSNTWYNDIGFSGVIIDNKTNRQIGGWSYYKYSNYDTIFFATYNEYPINTTLYYLNTFGWPLTASYCDIISWGVDMNLNYYACPTVNPLPALVQNFYWKWTGIGGTGVTAWCSALEAYGKYKASATFLCDFTIQYIIFYRLNNLNITYIQNANILNISFIPSFDGFINIKNAQSNFTYAFAKNAPYNAIIPFLNYTFDILDINMDLVYRFDLRKLQSLNCLGQPDTGMYPVRLTDAAGNLIVNFKIIYNNQSFISDTNGIVKIPRITNTNITVIPFFRPELAFNTTLTMQPGTTYITAPYFVYTVKIIARYIPPTGEQLPAGFNYVFNGEEYADKVNLTNPSVAVGGTAYDNITVQLLAGNYDLTLKTALTYLGMDIIIRQTNYSLSLFDDNYYRELTWYTGLFGDTINQNASNMPILSITVVNQDSKPVKNAYIWLNDTNNTNLAIKPTDENGNVIFYVQNGQIYNISVYYNNILKATKIVNYPADESVLQVSIQIYVSSIEETQQGPGIGQNLTQEQMQNQITAILMLILTNYAIWAFVFIIIFAAYAARISGSPEIGILTAVICIGVFTFIIPWLPVQILALLGVLAGIMLGLRVVKGRE